MNKAELVKAIAAKTSTKKEAAEFVDHLFETLVMTLKKKQPIAIAGFGTFKVRDRKARMGRNPKTGEAIKIPAKKKIVFRAAKQLKEAVIGK